MLGNKEVIHSGLLFILVRYDKFSIWIYKYILYAAKFDSNEFYDSKHIILWFNYLDRIIFAYDPLSI
jgi:hypothetical protein